LRWLYKLPTGFDYLSEAQRLGLPMESRIDEVVEALYLRPSYSATSPSGQAQCFSNVLENAQTAAKGLDIQAQQDVLTQKGRYLMATSLIQVEPLQLPEPSAKKASEKPKKQAPLWIPPPTHS
jgi:hypothetical protein